MPPFIYLCLEGFPGRVEHLGRDLRHVVPDGGFKVVLSIDAPEGAILTFPDEEDVGSGFERRPGVLDHQMGDERALILVINVDLGRVQHLILVRHDPQVGIRPLRGHVVVGVVLGVIIQMVIRLRPRTHNH